MKPRLYLDEDTMATALVVALRARGADVQTVVEAGLEGRNDKAQLEWAAANKRTLYTFNVSDFCRLHREYLVRGLEHAGIIVVPRSMGFSPPTTNLTSAILVRHGSVTPNPMRKQGPSFIEQPALGVAAGTLTNPNRLLAGRLLGHYEVVSFLGGRYGRGLSGA